MKHGIYLIRASYRFVYIVVTCIWKSFYSLAPSSGIGEEVWVLTYMSYKEFPKPHSSSPKPCSIKGWIASKKPTDNIIVVRTISDAGTYTRYIVVKCCSRDLLKLPRESLIELRGYGDDRGFVVTSYKILYKPVEEPQVDYTEDIERYDPEYLARYSQWFIRSEKWMKIVVLQNLILKYAREYLYSQGFLEILAPMIAPVSDPGLRGAKKLKTIFYGMEYELTSSVIMYKQVSASVFGKIFFMARNVREEPREHISTGRHLAEFTQLDLEWGLASIEDVMDLAEKLIHYITKKLADEHSDLVYSLNKGFEVIEPGYPRIKYDEALEIVDKLGYKVEWGKELSQEAETALAEYYGTPVWVIGYPAISRGFYYIPDPLDPRYNKDFNLILPKGYGEVIDGGEREYRYSKLLERLKSIGEPLEKYSWFIDTVKRGGVGPSAGWGLGVERLTRYIAGLRHIVLATAFPKLPGIVPTP